MSLTQKVLIIGGTGWIGHSFAKRFLETELLPQEQLLVANQSGKSGIFADYPDVTVSNDVAALVAQADIVVLAVRPQQLASLGCDLAGKLTISVMAGTSIESIKSAVNADKVIRTMPNAACELGQSYTPYFASEMVDAADIELLESLLAAVGEYAAVDSEDALNFLTGLAGCAPGMLTFYVNAYVNSAIQYGFERKMAESIARQVFAGSCAFVRHDPESPAQAMQTMLDYQGATAEGIQTLLDAGIQSCIDQSIHAAYQKAKSDMTK